MFVKPVRVVIVDNSQVFREMMSAGLNVDLNIEVIATYAVNLACIDLINHVKPDVVVIDMEQSGNFGVEFVKKLLPIYPVPIIMISATDSRVLEALSAGAIDFVLKPISIKTGIKGFINELNVKIKIAITSKISTIKNTYINESFDGINKNGKINLVAIGASTGGTEAILNILQVLPKEFPGIVIVQHIPPVFSNLFAERLNNLCKMLVKEAEDGEEVTWGKALVAPGNKQMKVVKQNGKIFVKCSDGEKVSGHCPSVNVLFNSIAECFSDDVIGVILTGMGNDGAAGLLNMRSRGSFTIGQDEKTSIVYGMPMEALRIGAIAEQSPLYGIADLLLEKIYFI